MIPNNNLSVLPFYKAKSDQNARKWWVGKVYPLFTPIGRLLPFQIQRPHRTSYAKGVLLSNEDYDTGYLTARGDWRQDNTTPAQVAVYNVTGKQRVYVENLPKPYLTPGQFILITANIVFKVNGIFIIAVAKPEEYYNGVIDIPAGATDMYIQAYNQQVGELSVSVYDVALETQKLTTFEIYHTNGELYGDASAIAPDVPVKALADNTDVIVYNGYELATDWDLGQYYIKLSDGVDTWYSEVFTIVQDTAGFLKLEWWDDEDFKMDAGTIVYTEPEFKNVLYLCSDIAKPEYDFDDEVIERDGYTFPVKQVSAKRYRFSFFAPEYLLDVLRFVRMSDYVRISKDGQTYTNIDSFLITPEWEKNGDIAAVDAEFTTATVAKKNGRGYITASVNE